ncbi:MAG: hypothetical protein EZS28_028688 [Streblomastix strix]|uniref:HMG box domain-containing protein n=1 Tax=Streblomastix strix TaxID=222440 RepID=A0A5J4V164_9EUKA|nr:MAG: hypothetical protein EZS28_028688 [Streblomastix strix]
MSHMNQSVISPILSTPLPQFGPFSPNVTRSPQSPFTPIPPPSIAYILAQQRAQQQARNRQQGIPHHSTPPTTPPSPSSSVASFGSQPSAPLVPPRNQRQKQYQTFVHSFAINQDKMESEQDTNIPFDEQSTYKLIDNEQVDIIKNEFPDRNQKEVASAILVRWNELEDSDKKDQIRKLEKFKDEDRKEDISLNGTDMQVESK